jgi:hypothetical protein
MIDGKAPAVAGNIPVELIKILEKSQLPVGFVSDRVCVGTGFELDVFAPDIGFLAIGAVFDMVGLLAARDSST